MRRDQLQDLLTAVAEGRLDVASAGERLACWPLLETEAAQLDLQRAARTGMPEVIFGEGKQPDQILTIVTRLVARGENVLATRCAKSVADEIRAHHADAVYTPLARCLTVAVQPTPILPGRVAIVAAGTADLPVAEEARVTAEFFGLTVQTHYDVGVAGLHRLLSALPEVRRADVVIAVAGMEGALASVIGGLVMAPVIAVPTSVGYGVQQHGRTALCAMLSSCAEGLTVVNIDNGFGAAGAAHRILRQAASIVDVK